MARQLAATWSSVVCSTCHNGVDTTTTNVDAHHVAIAGSSTCADCHDGTSTGIRLADHSAMVATYVNCSTCHTETGMTVAAGDPQVHDDCTTCHESSGVLKAAYGYASAMPDGGVGTNNGGGTCAACHGEYFDSHVNANHTLLVDEAATGCDSCHDATAGTATGVPTGADTKVHDNCATCHESTGVLKAAYGVASAMPDGGAGIR